MATEGSGVGSLVGHTSGGTIRNCCAEDATVVGSSEVGGLIGSCSAVLSGCYSTGAVSGQAVIGGLVAGNAQRITDCYSTANVDGNDSVGGLVGRPSGGRGSNLGLILNCYSAGRVTGTTAVGGLVGSVGANVVGSYWDIETSGQTASAGGVGRTTSQLQTAGTFLGWGACDHTQAWTIDEGQDYPQLMWQQQPGQPLGPLELADLLVGSGTAEDPFLIYTAEELNMIGLFPCEWSEYFKLMADVNMAEISAPFNTIGAYGIPCTGVFDGNDRSISNLVLTHEGGTGAGLFQYVADPNAVIKNLYLIDCLIDCFASTGLRNAATLVAYLEKATVANCHGIDNTVSGDSGVGGLVGRNRLGIVIDSTSTGTISGTRHIGGLVGDNGGSVTRCSSAAAVTGGTWVGGLVGSNSGDIADCFAGGTVTGPYSVGGLVGRNAQGSIVDSHASATVSGDRAGALVGYNLGAITGCYATGSATGGGSIGGLVGYNADGEITCCWTRAGVAGGGDVGGLVGSAWRGTIANCFATGDVRGNNNVGGLAGTIYRASVLNCYASGLIAGDRNVGGLVATVLMLKCFLGSRVHFLRS